MSGPILHWPRSHNKVDMYKKYLVTELIEGLPIWVSPTHIGYFNELGEPKPYPSTNMFKKVVARHKMQQVLEKDMVMFCVVYGASLSDRAYNTSSQEYRVVCVYITEHNKFCSIEKYLHLCRDKKLPMPPIIDEDYIHMGSIEKLIHMRPRISLLSNPMNKASIDLCKGIILTPYKFHKEQEPYNIRL